MQTGMHSVAVRNEMRLLKGKEFGVFGEAWAHAATTRQRGEGLNEDPSDDPGPDSARRVMRDIHEDFPRREKFARGSRSADK